MKLSKRQRLLEAYFSLTKHAGWENVESPVTSLVLYKGHTKLYNVGKERWDLIPVTHLILYPNCTYEIIEGALSYFDREILESLKFTKR